MHDGDKKRPEVDHGHAAWRSPFCGTRLAETLERIGVTERRLAERAGVSERTVRRIIRGERPQAETADLIETVVKARLDELLELEGLIELAGANRHPEMTSHLQGIIESLERLRKTTRPPRRAEVFRRAFLTQEARDLEN